MKIATLENKFAKAVSLQHDGQDYARTVAWLRSQNISPGIKTPEGKGIVPHLVHGGSSATVTIEW